MLHLFISPHLFLQKTMIFLLRSTKNQNSFYMIPKIDDHSFDFEKNLMTILKSVKFSSSNSSKRAPVTINTEKQEEERRRCNYLSRPIFMDPILLFGYILQDRGYESQKKCIEILKDHINFEKKFN